MPPLRPVITSQLIRDIYTGLCENADAYHAACDIIGVEFNHSCRAHPCTATMRLTREQYENRVAQLLAPLTVNFDELPLLQGNALSVPKATDLRRRHAETWNETLLPRVADWGRGFPSTCGTRFQNAIDAFVLNDDAGFWLENRSDRFRLEGLGDRCSVVRR